MLKSAESIGNLIHYYRIVNNISQAELAEKLNVTVSAISSWERGVSRPGIQVSYILANQMSMSLDEFLLDVSSSRLKDKYQLTDDIFFKNAIVRVLRLEEDNNQMYITFVVKGYQISQELLKNVFIVTLNNAQRNVLPSDIKIIKSKVFEDDYLSNNIPNHAHLNRYEVTLKFLDTCTDSCLFNIQFAEEHTTLEISHNIINLISHGPDASIKSAEDLINFFNSETYATALRFLAKNHQIETILKEIKESIKQLTQINKK